MNVIKSKYYSPFWSLFSGLLSLGLGFFLLLSEDNISENLIWAFCSIILLVAGVREFLRRKEEQNLKAGIISLSVYVAIATAFYLFSYFFVGLINIILAVLAFALFVMRVTIAVHIVKNGISGFVRNLISTIVCLVFAIVFLFYPTNDKINFSIFVLGAFFIVLGISLIAEFVVDMSGIMMMSGRTRRRKYLPMPNIVTATTTKRFLDECNEYVANHEDATVFIEEKEGTDQSRVNFEVMVHVSRKPGDFLGHVDIRIGDKVYTYGSYNKETHRLGILVAGGTFVINPRDTFIQNCLTDQRKYLAVYGCVLSDEQMKAVMKRIDEAMLDTEPIKITPDRCHDDVARFTEIGGKAYNVVKGPFKTYFAIASNCVKFADSVVGKAGFDEVAKGSITTPGVYLCMMENMFRRKNTRVIRRTVYLQQSSGYVKKEQSNLK